ncbi:hypothetical protein EDB89DRAFT_657487 [Lactarius sanguifluus]|nr:hypothetical protein EDB89DRAFT_657487 [Lactarius sanguifluus]
MGMGRREWVLRWTFSVSGIGAMTTPHLDFPGKELESLGKVEARRPSLPKVCVAETNPGRAAEDYYQNCGNYGSSCMGDGRFGAHPRSRRGRSGWKWASNAWRSHLAITVVLNGWCRYEGFVFDTHLRSLGFTRGGSAVYGAWRARSGLSRRVPFSFVIPVFGGLSELRNLRKLVVFHLVCNTCIFVIVVNPTFRRL